MQVGVSDLLLHCEVLRWAQPPAGPQHGTGSGGGSVPRRVPPRGRPPGPAASRRCADDSSPHLLLLTDRSAARAATAGGVGAGSSPRSSGTGFGTGAGSVSLCAPNPGVSKPERWFRYTPTGTPPTPHSQNRGDISARGRGTSQGGGMGGRGRVGTASPGHEGHFGSTAQHRITPHRHTVLIRTPPYTHPPPPPADHSRAPLHAHESPDLLHPLRTPTTTQPPPCTPCTPNQPPPYPSQPPTHSPTQPPPALRIPHKSTSNPQKPNALRSLHPHTSTPRPPPHPTMFPAHHVIAHSCLPRHRPASLPLAAGGL